MRPGFIKFIDAIGPKSPAESDNPVVSLVVNPAPSAAKDTGVKSLFLSFALSEIADFIDQTNDFSRNTGKYLSTTFLVGRTASCSLRATPK